MGDDLDQLTEDCFHVYFPVYTIADAKEPGVGLIVFDPDEVCHIQLMATENRSAFFMLFTDDDLAERAANAYSAIANQPYCCVVKIDSPAHLSGVLSFYQRNGVKYVGTDNHFGPNPYGSYRPIENVIRSCSKTTIIPEDLH